MPDRTARHSSGKHRKGRRPFVITLNKPNRETIAALLEAERIAKDPAVKGYSDIDDLFAALDE